MLDLKPYLKLRDTDRMKGVMFEYYVAEDDPQLDEKVSVFVKHVYTDMPRETGWFHQSGSGPDRLSNYQMFEFWDFNRHSDLVIEHCKKIADAIGMQLEIDLRRLEKLR